MNFSFNYPFTFLILFASVIFFPKETSAQFVFNKQIDVPVYDGNKTLRFPWVGGLNNPQFSGVDLNNDGIKDLFIFDRTGDKAITFINGGTPGEVDYDYDPSYEYPFSNFIQWALMDDFDCDGVPDVFTYWIGAADYYRGRYTTDNKIEFDSVTFLGYESFSGYLNIFISAIDIAAFVDVNNDGDLDVLTFDIFGGFVQYFENQSMELTGTCGDTVLFHLVDDCWGGFFESGITNLLDLSYCRTCDSSGKADGNVMIDYSAQKSGVGEPRHAGSTLMAFDENADGLLELVLGDVSYDRLNRALNGGTVDSACAIAQDPTFPAYDRPFQMPLFPAAFYVDVNNDGNRDMLVAPNARLISENYNCIWYYKNIGKDDSAYFQFVTDTFLIDDMLDFGEGAHPAFFDYNGDGLLDLVVGNYGYYVNGVVFRSGLALLENVGTTTSPEFRLIDRDYANVSQLNRSAIVPAFGDMDGDGDIDMIVGDVEGYLHYYRNNAGPGNPAQFSLVMPEMFGIDIGQFATPFIYDVNGDGLPDLVVGRKNGTLHYYENTGTASAFQFSDTPTNNFFGRVNVRIPGFPNGYSAPVITTLDSTGKLYLLSGSEEGNIKVYLFDRDSIYGGTFEKRFDDYSKIDEGERINITIADISGDGMLEMVAGNYRGGVSFFTQSNIIYTGEKPVAQAVQWDVKIFPNPAQDFIQIQMNGLKTSGTAEIELFDLMGKSVLHDKIQIEPMQSLKLPELNSGIYFLRVNPGEGVKTVKLFLQR